MFHWMPNAPVNSAVSLFRFKFLKIFILWKFFICWLNQLREDSEDCVQTWNLWKLKKIHFNIFMHDVKNGQTYMKSLNFLETAF